MNILITGGSGFLGSHITSRLLEKGNYVAIVDRTREDKMAKNFLDSIKGNKDAHFYNADILDKASIENILRSDTYNAIIHLAAKSNVRESVDDVASFESINVKGTLNLLDAARKFDVGKFIFASSSSVYGSLNKKMFSEDDNTDNHVSPYGATKKAGEILCRLYNSMYGLDTIALRFFTVYGPRGRLDMAVSRFIKSIDSDETVEVHDKGKISRDFLYIEDAVKSVELCLKKKFGFEAFNIGSGKSCKLNQLIKIIEKHTGKKARIKYTPMQKGDVFSTRADIKKARKLLGWQPKTSLEDGIRKTVEWWNNGGKNLY